MNPNPTETSSYHVNLPADLLRQFRAVAAARGETLRGAAADALRAWVAEKGAEIGWPPLRP